MKVVYLFSLSIFTLLLFACGGESRDESTTISSSGDPGIDQITALIADNPEQADLYASRAQMEYERENYDAAIVDLQTALNLDSTQINYYYQLSDVFMNYFRSRQAIGVLNSAVLLDENNAETWLRLGEAQLVTKQYEDATAALNQVVRVDPRNPDAYLLLGQVFAETGDTTRAINATQEAVEIEPDLIDGWIKLGQLHSTIGSERAEQYFNTALDLDSLDVISIHAKADFYRDQDRLDDAIALYRKAARLDRQYVVANFNTGLLLMEQGKIGEAHHEFNIVTSNDPLYIQAHFYKGYANELMGNIDAAREDYRNALRLAPEYQLALEGMNRVGVE
ncbi:MAG: tetratricopeptide repeat protein [Bacteroidota bacterium]